MTKTDKLLLDNACVSKRMPFEGTAKKDAGYTKLKCVDLAHISTNACRRSVKPRMQR
jgi:hypothetical protein